MIEENCLTCVYEPDWGHGKYKANYGECKWPCPPCLKKLMQPVCLEKLFPCPAWKSKWDIK